METEGRLYLKEINIEDLDESVMTWFKDEALMKYYTSSKKEITRDELVKSISEGKVSGNLFTYGIFFRENNKLIGTIKLGPINFNHRTSDLVVLIGNRDFHGKGFSVEAIKLGNKLAFDNYNIRKLYGGMYLSNIASIKAYRKAGWLIEGRLKGQYLVNDIQEDRLLVACFNPKYFSNKELAEIKNNEQYFYQ